MSMKWSFEIKVFRCRNIDSVLIPERNREMLCNLEKLLSGRSIIRIFEYIRKSLSDKHSTPNI